MRAPLPLPCPLGVLALAVALSASAVAAQPTLTIGGGPAVVAAGGFGDAWQPGVGLGFHVEVPAYGGTARALLAHVPFAAQTDGLPGFGLTVTTLGWTLHTRLGGATLGAGPHVGLARFGFDDRAEALGQQTSETETVVGLHAGVRLPVVGPVGAWAEAEAMRVALAAPRTLVALRAGVAVRVAVPDAVARLAR